MSSIRIAIATALAAAFVFAGGVGHTHHAAPAASHTAALAAAPRSSPVLCC
jgi:Flp pilus assembly protein CpaB